MKSKTSCFNKTIFKKNITHYWPIWGIILLWNLFILPFMIYDSSLQYRIMTNMTQAQIEQQRVHDILSLVGVYVSPAMLFVFAVAAVMAVFSYLYSARSAYTFHALPVTRLELFVTNFISGLLFLLVPQIVGFLTGTLISVICGYTSINHLFTGLLLAAGISVFFYTFTVCIAMFTGQLFAVPVFALILNFLFVGCKVLFSALLEILSYGVTWSFSGSRLDLLSPLYYLMRRVRIDYDYSSGAAAVPGIRGTGAVAAYAAVSLVFAAVAFYVYQKRHLETAGSLISVPVICPVFRWGAAICSGCLFGMMFSSLLGLTSSRAVFWGVTVCAIVFGAVGFFVAQMFLEKGFRVFGKKRLAECGVFAAALFVALFSIECDFFGQEKKMPDPSEVESAYLTSSYVLGGEGEENVRWVGDIHSQIISSKKEFESFAGKHGWGDGDLLSVTVKYYLKNGSVFRRSYDIPATKEMILDHATVVGQMAKRSVVPEVYLNNLFGGDYENVIIKEGSMDFYDSAGAYDSRWISEKDAKVLYRAVLDDAMAGNFKSLIESGFRYGGMEDTTDQVYYNTISLEYTFKNESAGNKKKEQQEYNIWSGPGSASISFDKNCTNLIDALKKIGLIKSEKELFTREDMDRLGGNEAFVD